MEKLLKTFKKQLASQQHANNGRKGKIKQLKKDVKNHQNVQKEFDEKLKYLEMEFTDLETLVQNFTGGSVSTSYFKMSKIHTCAHR